MCKHELNKRSFTPIAIWSSIWKRQRPPNVPESTVYTGHGPTYCQWLFQIVDTTILTMQHVSAREGDLCDTHLHIQEHPW